MGLRTFLRSFAGGEISQQMFGRLGDARFQTGLGLARNFYTLPHGPARNRPGTRFSVATKTGATEKSRVIPFKYSTTQTLTIEMGPGYFRFLDDGVPVSYSTPAAYVANVTVPLTAGDSGALTPGVDTNTECFVTAVAHGLTTGDRICVTAESQGITSPYPVQFWLPENPTYYYAIVVNAQSFQIASEAGGAAINITTVGSGGAALIRWHRAYETGKLVSYTNDYYCQFLPIVYDVPSQRYLSASPGSPEALGYWWQLVPGIFEVPHPYAEADLFKIRFEQSNDVITFTYKTYPVYQLQRLGATNWPFVAEPFAPTLPAPTGVAGVATESGDFYTMLAWVGSPNSTARFRVGDTGNDQAHFAVSNGSAVYIDQINQTYGLGSTPLDEGAYLVDRVDKSDFDLRNVHGHTRVYTAYAGSDALTSARLRVVPIDSERTNKYVVTAVDDGGRESQPSAEITVTNNLFAEGAYNTITWDAVAGAQRYIIYRFQTGVFGQIGTLDADQTRTFKDDAAPIDIGHTPPILDTDLSGTDYPTAVGHHQQRKVFGGTTLFPQQIWMTRSGSESDLSYSLPEKDDDAVSFALATYEQCTIMHLITLGRLICLTSSAEFIIESPDSSVITPTSIMADAHTYVGSSDTRPVIANNVLVFFPDRGGHVQQLALQATAQGFQTTDLSLRAAHLFDGYTIVDSAFAKAPYPIVWMVSSSGDLLGMTFLPDQEVLGWHHHDTQGGTFESCCVVSEGNEDVLYVVVKRTISGGTVRYIERLAPMIVDDLEDMVFVDSSVTLTSPGTGQIGGLTHLIGLTVSILADGIVLPQQTVNGSGEIALTTAYAKVTVGIPIVADFQTLPVAAQIEAFGQGRTKNLSKVWVRTSNSAPFQLGPDAGDLTPSDPYAPSVAGTLVAETLADATVPVRVPQSWGDDGQVFLRQTLPLPVTVVALVAEVTYGG